MKKTLVVLLAMVLIFAFAATAMAADTQYTPYGDIDKESAEIQTAIERLSVLGALKGYDAEGTKFAPAQLITREEFATIGVRIAGLEDQVALYASMASNFKDVAEGRWSEGYINCANQNGIMVGRGNGVFDPKANVTMQEVATVLLRAVGYDDRLPGAWPSDYNTKAVNVGITEYVNFIGPKYATRGEVASLVNEALDLWTVQYVENSTAAGLGQIISGIYNTLLPKNIKDQLEDTFNIPVIDKDGYMYVANKTNENGYGLSLLNQTFKMHTAPMVVFYDEVKDGTFSEANGWYFDDFDKYELMASIRGQIIKDTKKDFEVDTRVDDMEFATLYGISGKQDITDLAGQIADLTVNDDDEIVFINTLSSITRTNDADDDYDADGILEKGTLEEKGYGEYWEYDFTNRTVDDIYFSKDFSVFEDDEFGIVKSADEEDVNFINGYSIRLDDKQDEVFYALGEGFVAGKDLAKGDVVYYAGEVGDKVDMYIVIRATEANFDKMAAKYIEIDGFEYGVQPDADAVAADNSFYSVDGLSHVYTYDYAMVKDYDWSTKVTFAPSYAFTKFALLADSIDHYKYGVIDHYIYGKASKYDRISVGNQDTVTGAVIVTPDGKYTEFEFDTAHWKMFAALGYPEEGSLAEFIVDKDGVITRWKTLNVDNKDLVVGHGFGLSNNTKMVHPVEGSYDMGYVWAEYTTKGRLHIYDDQKFGDTFKFADDAVVFVAESTADAYPDFNGVYDFDSAKAMSATDFQKEYGDFHGWICLYDVDGTTINTMYVVDPDKEANVTYGIGLYTGNIIKSISGGYYYVVIGGEVVKIDDDVIDGLEEGWQELDKVDAIVAYRLTDGIVDDIDDIFPIYDCDSAKKFATSDMFKDWYDEYELNIACGDLDPMDKKSEIWLSDLKEISGDLGSGATFFLGDFKAGYDFIADDVLNWKDIYDSFRDNEDKYADAHVLVFYDDANENDAIYALVLKDHNANW